MILKSHPGHQYWSFQAQIVSRMTVFSGIQFSKKKKEEHAYLPVFLFNIVSLYLKVHHSSIPQTSAPHK